MKNRTRLFAHIVCFELAVAVLVVAAWGATTRPAPTMDDAIAATPQTSAADQPDDCTGSAGFWAPTTDPATGRPKMECRRYA